MSALADLDVWILDALRYRPHPSHLSLSDALGWIERIKPRRAILTNLHADLDYEVLRGKLPVHVVPAFDGMTIHCCRCPVIPGVISSMFHNMSYANQANAALAWAWSNA